MILPFLQRIQSELLKLVRTSDQLSHAGQLDVTALRQKLQGIDELAEDFTLRMDARRKNIATAINFYRLASQVIGSSTILYLHSLGSVLFRDKLQFCVCINYILNGYLQLSPLQLRVNGFTGNHFAGVDRLGCARQRTTW